MVISGKKKNYKDDFYADGTKLFCIVCKHVVDHKQKSTIDNHLETPYVFLCIENTKNLLRAGIENPPLNQTVLLFKEIQSFNPNLSELLQKNISLYSYIKEFINPEDEWIIYSEDNEFLVKGLDLNKYWNDKQLILPLFSRIALEYMWLPVSGVDVE
ncbi:2808_t:CDS:2 [Entrophospora sp. SA101]|nr:2808_t:CDS:2 [Entrophospora sp. SA101]CAJ0867646.1 4645_t:CDS:2 [Entrophospora sp. SA101]